MRYTVNRSKVVLEHFDDETILINMDTCVYYSLNECGREAWKLIEAGQSTEAIGEALSWQYESDTGSIAASVRQLLEELVAEGLVEPAEGPPAVPSPVPQGAAIRRPFEPPALARYTDMQDLLLLDPIHDVDATGWPNARQEPNGVVPARRSAANSK
jgi:hypothetical protein